MNVKNFIIGGVVGGIVDFLLGWAFYGMLFKDIYPQNENTNLSFIFIGCMLFGFLISYIFTQLADVKNMMSGLTAGAIIGFLMGLSMNFFMYSGMALNVQNMITDVGINIVLGAGVGAAVAFAYGKMK